MDAPRIACMPKYSRAHPSPRYQYYIDLYRSMHESGSPTFEKRPIYLGYSLARHIRPIKKLVSLTNSKTLLDYGSGKGELYQIQIENQPSFIEVLNVESVTCYDPAYPKFAKLPQGTFDGVVCIDVLEHIPEEDIEWVIDELFSYATKFVYINVASVEAVKKLPDNTNAHCTVKSPLWWKDKVKECAKKYPELKWKLSARVEHKAFGKTKFAYRVASNFSGGD